MLFIIPVVFGVLTVTSRCTERVIIEHMSMLTADLLSIGGLYMIQRGCIPFKQHFRAEVK